MARPHSADTGIGDNGQAGTSRWTVITKPPSLSERWVAWILRRPAPFMPWLVAVGGLAWLLALWRVARTFGDPWFFTFFWANVGPILLLILICWERRGYASLVERYEAELNALRRPADPANPYQPSSGQ